MFFHLGLLKLVKSCSKVLSISINILRKCKEVKFNSNYKIQLRKICAGKCQLALVFFLIE